MKYLKYVWTVLWNIIVIIFVIAILSESSYGSSDSDAIALIFILLSSLKIGFAIQMRTNLNLFFLTTKQNASILKSLGNNSESESLENDSNEIETLLLDTKYKFWINSLGAGVVSLIAVLTLMN